VRLVGDGVEHLELLIVILVNLQNRGFVTTSVAIVRRRPDGYEGLVEEELEAFVHKLMRAADELKAVHRTKLLSNLGAEEPTSAALGDLPGVDVRLRVGPDEVTEGALVRSLLVTVNEAQLIQRGDLGRQTTVHTNDSAINDT